MKLNSKKKLFLKILFLLLFFLISQFFIDPNPPSGFYNGGIDHEGINLVSVLLQWGMIIPYLLSVILLFLHLKSKRTIFSNYLIRFGSYIIVLIIHFISIRNKVWNGVFNPLSLLDNHIASIASKVLYSVLPIVYFLGMAISLTAFLLPHSRNDD